MKFILKNLNILLGRGSKLKKIMALLALAAAFWGGLQAQNEVGTTKKNHHQAETIVGRVVRVSDGDTLVLLTEGKEEVKVRMNFIDTPETAQAYGQKAKVALTDLVKGQVVRLDSQEVDRYGRVLGTIWLNDQNINYQMVVDGYAWHYVQYAKKSQSSADFTRYADAELNARLAKKGLWADKKPQAPWLFRQQKRTTK
jgi:endonuclease YncB( thermonuclease family)